MKRSSTSRILTTHVGSLPRPADLAEMLLARQDQTIEEVAFRERVHAMTNEVVAQRIVQFSQLVGAEKVIASTDCGVGTFVAAGIVHPKGAWLKLQSLVAGAALAAQELSKAK